MSSSVKLSTVPKAPFRLLSDCSLFSHVVQCVPPARGALFLGNVDDTLLILLSLDIAATDADLNRNRAAGSVMALLYRRGCGRSGELGAREGLGRGTGSL